MRNKHIKHAAAFLALFNKIIDIKKRIVFFLTKIREYFFNETHSRVFIRTKKIDSQRVFKVSFKPQSVLSIFLHSEADRLSRVKKGDIF